MRQHCRENAELLAEWSAEGCKGPKLVRDDFFEGERFGSVGEAREEAARWCREEAGVRTHGRTRRSPIDVFEEEEEPLLLPAPTEPYDQPMWGTYRVGRDRAVLVEHGLYSVP